MSKRGGGKFLFGLLVGAGAALLLAPKPGKELRKDLKEKFDELMDRINEVEVDELKNSISNKIKEIEYDLTNLDKETVLKTAKNKAGEIETKLEDLIVAAGKTAKPHLEKIANDVKEKTALALKDILDKMEEDQKK